MDLAGPACRPLKAVACADRGRRAIGWIVAQHVQVTEMPLFIAAIHGFVGFAAVFIGFITHVEMTGIAGTLVAGKILHRIMVSDVLIQSQGTGACTFDGPSLSPSGAEANSVTIPVERCGMWWQCRIQRAASPASIAIVTMAIRGT